MLIRSVALGISLIFTFLSAAQAPFVKDQPLAGYKGVDAQMLFAALQATAEPVQNKFEDPKVFEARKMDYAARPVLGDIRKDSTIAFLLKPETSYDFDKKTYTLVLNEHKNMDLSNLPMGIRAFDLFTTSKTIEAPGQNSYGAQALIQRTTVDSYIVALRTGWMDNNHLSSVFMMGGFKFKLPMESDEAKKVDGTVDILIWGKLIEPKVFEGYRKSGTATLQDPREVEDRQHTILLKMEGIAAFDLADGQVFKRIDL